MRRWAFLIAALALGAGSLHAQGLGEAAAKEKRRREEEQKKKAGGRVFTNDDLTKGAGGSEAPPPSATTPSQNPAQRAGRPPGGQDPDDPAVRERRRSPTGAAPSDDVGDAGAEPRWRSEAQSMRGAFAAAEAQVKARQAELESIAGRIMLSSDTNEILRLRAEKSELDAALQQAQQGLTEARTALEQFEQRAQRAGVPSGWIR